MDSDTVTITLTREQAEAMCFGSALFQVISADVEAVLINNSRATDRMRGLTAALDAIADQLREAADEQ